MMCLGWYNRPTCAAREQIQIAPGVSPCPTVSWFWIVAGLILAGGVMKKDGQA